MITFEILRRLSSAAKLLILAVVLAPAVGFTQPALQSLSDKEQQLLDEIDREMALNGPYSEALIDPLTELSLHYEDIGALAPAEETIRQALSVIRANQGFLTLDQVPIIRQLIRREEERGNIPAAWDLDQELLMLAEKNPNDVRSADIYREMGAKRMAVLSRYDAGEFPPEIVLGCFYDDTQIQDRIRFVGSQPLATVRTGADGRRCSAGDRSVARRSLAASAQWLYLQAVSVLFRSGQNASTEVPEILNEIVRISYLFTNPGLGSMSLENLIAYESEHSVDRLRRIEALVQRADWDLLYASDLGTRFVQSARETYEQAYQEAVEYGIAQESVDEIFSPAIPVVLPSFMANPLVSEQTPRSMGYIDLSFVVTEDGKSKHIEVLDTSTADLPRDARKDLVRIIKFSRFRPRVTDGRFMDSAPIVVRYYVNE